MSAESPQESRSIREWFQEISYAGRVGLTGLAVETIALPASIVAKNPVFAVATAMVTGSLASFACIYESGEAADSSGS